MLHEEFKKEYLNPYQNITLIEFAGLTSSQVLSQLGSDEYNGLSEVESSKRFKEIGPNLFLSMNQKLAKRFNTSF